MHMCFLIRTLYHVLVLFLIIERCKAWSPLYSSSTASSSVETSSSGAPPTSSTSPWFPRRIQESVNYKEVVPSVYARQIVTETHEMARMAVQLYLDSRDQDPFASVAEAVSVLPETKVGWISTRQEETSILPPEVQEAIFAKSPKTGDVHILASNNGQYHVVKVDELAILHQPKSSPTTSNDVVVGSHSGINAVVPRSKLKGQGVIPTLPSSPKTYLIHTAGCQMNVADTERLAGVLETQLHLAPSTTPQEADVVIFNTCTIRDHAESKVFDALGPYAAQKRKGKQFALVVTGCVAQQEGQALLKRVPEVDVILGPQYVPHLHNVLASVEWGHQVVATSPMIHQEDLFSKPVRGHDLKAWVNVIYGCNEHCTYCVVPAVRGMEQSRPMESVLQECLQLVKNGYKEITLLGQNIDAYGRDMNPKRTFCDLLHYLNTNLVDHKVRIRYVTSHPRYFSDRVIDAVANLDKVCECFHMPFQAGDDNVLKRMRRGYTFESYMTIIHKIRSKAPDASICGDVIVGFPGETDEAFQRTLDLMKAVKFDNLNTFAYSPRPNTEAALWDNQIPDEIKSERLQIVQKLAAEHGLERSKRYVGRTVQVLVEDGNPRNPNQCMGRTRQGRQLFFDGDLTKLRGEFVDVKITKARTWSLMGELAA